MFKFLLLSLPLLGPLDCKHYASGCCVLLVARSLQPSSVWNVGCQWINALGLRRFPLMQVSWGVISFILWDCLFIHRGKWDSSDVFWEHCLSASLPSACHCGHAAQSMGLLIGSGPHSQTHLCRVSPRAPCLSVCPVLVAGWKPLLFHSAQCHHYSPYPGKWHMAVGPPWAPESR